MNLFVMRTNSPEETFSFAEKLARFLKEGMVIAITGELGAGKTLFAQGIARGLGVKDTVTSPTYTIINEYCGQVPFYHLDLYRLEDEREILELGLEEYLESSGVVLIEWPERVENLLPASCIKIQMEKGYDHQGQEFRRIIIFSQDEETDLLIGEFAENENIGS
jgi:tRNA threonylcarbamoyladenosine biosynthesis protein TsaE